MFPDCDYKKNNILESEFVIHLSDKHSGELKTVSAKENIPIDMVRMMTISNSKVFINS